MRNFHRLIEHCAVLGQGRAATSVLVELNVEEAMRNDIYDILNIGKLLLKQYRNTSITFTNSIFSGICG